MNKFKKIIICSPGDVLISGGVNSLHNLCKALVENGYNASMYYLNPKQEVINSEYYLSYNVTRSNVINDDSETLLIVPETLVPYLFYYKNAGKMVYWLGLSLFMKTPTWKSPFHIKLFRKLIKCRSYFGYSTGSIEEYKRKLNEYAKSHLPIWNGDVLHACNSDFVAGYCRNKGIEAFVLHNPVRDEFYDDTTLLAKREKIILLGPKTSRSLINKLKKTCHGFSIVKIKKMPSQKVFELMSKAMIFVEIGNFSGRDRMPREAALRGCIVITNTRGSASNQTDYNFNKSYKIEESDITSIVRKVSECINDYESHFANQLSFREQLINERNQFYLNTDKVFSTFVHQ